MFKNLRIATRLGLGFAIIVLLILAKTLYNTFDVQSLYSNIQKIYDHPLQVSNSVQKIEKGIFHIHSSMKDVVISTDEFYKNQKVLEINNAEQEVLREFDIIFQKYLGDMDEVEKPYNNFMQWREMHKQILLSTNNSNINELIKTIQHEHNDYVQTIINDLEILYDFAQNKANELRLLSLDGKQANIRSQLIVLAVLIIFIIGLAIMLIQGIIRPVGSIQQGIDNITSGKLSQPFDYPGNDEFKVLANSLIDLRKKLLELATVAQKVSEGETNINIAIDTQDNVIQVALKKILDTFRALTLQADNISKGDLSTNITIKSDKDLLGMALNQMQATLQEVVFNAQEIAKGNLDVIIMPNSKKDELAKALNLMATSLKDVREKDEQRARVRNSINELNLLLRGDQELNTLSKKILQFLAHFSNGQVGTFYFDVDDNQHYKLIATYAFTNRKNLIQGFKTGEGLIGQAALEKEIINLSELPDDYIRIQSGLGNQQPTHLLIVPFIYNNTCIGVLEIGSIYEFNHYHIDFIKNIQENVAIGMVTAINRKRVNELLTQTQTQADKLQVQQEELRQTNEELEEQTKALKKSEDHLQTQQEELRVANEELEERTKELEEQKNAIEKNNTELALTQSTLEEKAKQLEITSKYKSEFLANMSHELRTPLNSLLILSQTLEQNDTGNLTDEQIEITSIIHKSGKDLLLLINEILDLSKIESGKLQMDFSNVSIDTIAEDMKLQFKHVADEKGLDFNIVKLNKVPETIYTDIQRVEQIIKNLLSNAIKFTEKGKVELIFGKTPEKNTIGITYNTNILCIAISDTGIGIPKSKLLEIFEAFQQVDGGISRKYGGTGLGLSISRELAKLLHGEIIVESSEGIGSTFYLVLPVTPTGAQSNAAPGHTETPKLLKQQENKALDKAQINKLPKYSDDRENIDTGDQVILIIEDDMNFGNTMINFCHKKDFKCIACASGEEGIEMAIMHHPVAIILDIKLPGISGMEVLDFLKHNNETRHIPVHTISAEDFSHQVLTKGAIGFLNKPIDKPSLNEMMRKIHQFSNKQLKDLLIIEDDKNMRDSIIRLIGKEDIKIHEIDNGRQGIEMVKNNQFDCIILDLGLPDISGFDFLAELKNLQIEIPPIVIYTGRDLTKEENEELQQYSSSIIVKGVRSQERLLDETALFLHRVVSKMPERQKNILNKFYNKDKAFEKRCILIVDDDMRNIFALTQVLETSKVKVLKASNGQKALDILNNQKGIDLVLMDIMMPVMDGYQAIKHIRNNEVYKHVPVIAVTAKAMKEDYEKCMEAGANDYISKPVDIDKFFSLLRIWLY